MYPGQNVPPSSGQGWSGPPVGPPASLGLRFAARLIDGILLYIVSLVVVFVVVIGVVFSASEVSMFGGGNSIAGWVGTLLMVIIFLAYAVVLESRSGQTLGKMAVGIQVRVSDGGYPSTEQALKRNAWMALQLIPILGWLVSLVAVVAIAVTINSNKNGAGWHDDLAGTRVFRTR